MLRKRPRANAVQGMLSTKKISPSSSRRLGSLPLSIPAQAREREREREKKRFPFLQAAFCVSSRVQGEVLGGSLHPWEQTRKREVGRHPDANRKRQRDLFDHRAFAFVLSFRSILTRQVVQRRRLRRQRREQRVVREPVCHRERVGENLLLFFSALSKRRLRSNSLSRRTKRGKERKKNDFLFPCRSPFVLSLIHI